MKENKREIELSFDFFRQAKKKTIHTLMDFGKTHPFLKYPMFAVTVVFIFIYNMFLHLFIQLHMREKLARGLAFAMSAILVLTSIDITAFAMSQIKCFQARFLGANALLSRLYFTSAAEHRKPCCSAVSAGVQNQVESAVDDCVNSFRVDYFDFCY